MTDTDKRGLMKLDFSLRCKRCGKLIKGKKREREFSLYKPFCSYACKEWYPLEKATEYLALKKELGLEG